MRGVRIRLFERTKGGVFYRSAWIPNHGEDRKCLGTCDRAEADRMGTDLLAALLRSDRIESSGALPLGHLWEKYSSEAVQFLDNHERTRQEAAFHAAILIGFFGENCDVRDLTQQDQLAFAKKRQAGGIAYTVRCGSGMRTEKSKPVRARAVEVEVKLLYAMLRWATTVRLRKGQRMLDHHPLAGVKTAREVNPKRPVATAERYEATRDAIRQLCDESAGDAERRK